MRIKATRKRNALLNKFNLIVVGSVGVGKYKLRVCPVSFAHVVSSSLCRITYACFDSLIA